MTSSTVKSKPSRFANFRSYLPKMSLLKSVLCKLTNFRFGLGGSNTSPASGDYYWNGEEIDWAAVSHPSTDPYGNPITAMQYYHRRRLGAMGFPVPPLEIDQEELDDQNEKREPLFVSPRSLPTPNVSTLRLTLPPETHRFLHKASKKDCRTWLWKNEIGRQARLQISLLQPQVKAQKPNSKFTCSRHNFPERDRDLRFSIM